MEFRSLNNGTSWYYTNYFSACNKHYFTLGAVSFDIDNFTVSSRRKMFKGLGQSLLESEA